ncbi:MAG: tyrosine-type recombinase/integrase [Xanthobacteraceae bacterium]
MSSEKTFFTEKGVRDLELPPKGPKEFQKDYFQKLNRGLTLVLRVSYGGTKAWRIVTYEKGRAKARTLGHFPEMTVAKAIKAAHAYDPRAAKASAEAGSFKDVAEQWLKQYVDKKGLRSKGEIERQLKTYVYPAWAAVPFFEIRRKTVSTLLDKIADAKGTSMADGVLATLRSIMNWYATRDDDYTSPIVKGMQRDPRSTKERARQRILSDNEIRAVWRATEGIGPFGALLRLLLLTGQRRDKVATMKRADIKDGVWTIATEEREKGNAGELRLPPIALTIIAAQDEVVGNPYVFPGNERKRQHRSADRSKPPCFNSWSKSKARLGKALPADMPGWTIHDLRRTARSLMSRAGVSSDHAERVLGHAISGVEGVYDRHPYLEEKAVALNKLAQLIELIVNPPEDNVVPFKPTGAALEV